MSTTTTASGPRERPTFMAAHTAVPVEPPTRMPSSLVTMRAVRNESRSLTFTTWSTTSRS